MSIPNVGNIYYIKGTFDRCYLYSWRYNSLDNTYYCSVKFHVQPKKSSYKTNTSTFDYGTGFTTVVIEEYYLEDIKFDDLCEWPIGTKVAKALYT